MKNKFMRIAAVMLMLCLVTTCAISGTFAKYTTEAFGTDTARVAYWGWDKDNAEIKITNLFATSYDFVTSKNTDKVIAPGTSNSGTFQFLYEENATEGATSPEVAYTFKIDLTGTTASDDIKNNGNIKWAVCKTEDVTNNGGAIPTGEWGTWDAMITELNALDGDESFDAGEALPAIATDAYTIAWMWDFSTGTAGDEADTAMGNKEILDTVTISIKITATQVNA